MWRSPAGAVLLIAGAIAAPAVAADRPPYLPTRDVSVTYQIEADAMPGGAGPHMVKLSYSAASGRARIDQPDGPGYLILDRAGGRALMVMEPVQTYIDMPFSAQQGTALMMNDKMRFTRAGSDRVAGLNCALWDVVSDKTTARLCVTDDGVILRGEGSDPARGAGKMVATAVSYADLQAALFTPPAGFRRMALPPGLTLPAMTAPSPRRPPG